VSLKNGCKGVWKQEETDLYICQETGQIVNIRPLARCAGFDLNPLTPANLMMGQGTAGVPSIQFERGGQLTRRLQAIKEAKDEYWDR
jgi:hypothetical protein